MNEEAERRIAEARARAERERQTAEFLASITDKDSLLKPIYNPEAFVMREKYRGAANRGDMPRTECTHPFQHINQFLDDDPAVARNKPVNLFECGVCHMPLWLVDPWGNPISDD